MVFHYGRRDAWMSRATRKRENRRALLLNEIVVLRRMALGEGTNAIARGLVMDPSSISHLKRKLRAAFEVNDDDELLNHPLVREQIKE